MQVSHRKAAAACTQAAFVAAVANVSDLQTSASLLSESLTTLGMPSNSTIFLPIDSAWTAFQATNGVHGVLLRTTAAVFRH